MVPWSLQEHLRNCALIRCPFSPVHQARGAVGSFIYSLHVAFLPFAVLVVILMAATSKLLLFCFFLFYALIFYSSVLHHFSTIMPEKVIFYLTTPVRICMWHIIMCSSSLFFVFCVLEHVISGVKKGFHRKSVLLYLRLNLSLERYGTDYFRLLRLPPHCHLMFGSCCSLINFLAQVSIECSSFSVAKLVQVWNVPKT